LRLVSRVEAVRGVVVGVASVGSLRVTPGLDVLWRAHSAELLRYGAVLVGPHDCEDVVSAAFIRVCTAIDVDDIDSPRPYLFRAVLHEALNHRRSARARWRRDLHGVAVGVVAPTEPHLEVRHAVADLSVRQRAVVFFAYWQDLPERAIADQLGISLGSVRRHLVRAQAHLRKALM
jgi:DNA-directed RNA polymerase specialized sigma24 family protein